MTAPARSKTPRRTTFDPLWLALGTLTVVRVPAPTSISPVVAGQAMLLAPVVALVPALTAATVFVLAAAAGVPALTASALTIGALALATRGLHLDGLADTADGMACGYDRERALAVMRSGDTGPGGVMVLVVVALAQTGSLAALPQSWSGAAFLVVAVVVSRAVLVLGCLPSVPAARTSGLGATVAGSVGPVTATAALLLATALAALVVAGVGRPWWHGLLGAAAAVAVAALVLARCVQRLGGMTGDVLGACVEVALTASLVVLASLG